MMIFGIVCAILIVVLCIIFVAGTMKGVDTIDDKMDENLDDELNDNPLASDYKSSVNDFSDHDSAGISRGKPS